MGKYFRTDKQRERERGKLETRGMTTTTKDPETGQEDGERTCETFWVHFSLEIQLKVGCPKEERIVESVGEEEGI